MGDTALAVHRLGGRLYSQCCTGLHCCAALECFDRDHRAASQLPGIPLLLIGREQADAGPIVGPPPWELDSRYSALCMAFAAVIHLLQLLLLPWLVRLVPLRSLLGLLPLLVRTRKIIGRL